MGSEKIKSNENDYKYFQFDPTIHAGHIITVITIIFCSIGAWYDMRSSVATIKEVNAQQDKELSDLRGSQEKQNDQISQDINALAAMNRQDMIKIREEMNIWFMRLSDKIDMKADKR